MNTDMYDYYEDEIKVNSLKKFSSSLYVMMQSIKNIFKHCVHVNEMFSEQSLKIFFSRFTIKHIVTDDISIVVNKFYINSDLKIVSLPDNRLYNLLDDYDLINLLKHCSCYDTHGFNACKLSIMEVANMIRCECDINICSSNNCNSIDFVGSNNHTMSPNEQCEIVITKLKYDDTHVPPNISSSISQVTKLGCDDTHVPSNISSSISQDTPPSIPPSISPVDTKKQVYLSERDYTYSRIYDDMFKHKRITWNSLPPLFISKFVVYLFMDGKDEFGNGVRTKLFGREDEVKIFDILSKSLCDDFEPPDNDEYIAIVNDFVESLPPVNIMTCDEVNHVLNEKDRSKYEMFNTIFTEQDDDFDEEKIEKKMF